MDVLWERVKGLAVEYAAKGQVPTEEEAETRLYALAHDNFVSPALPAEAARFLARELRIMTAELIYNDGKTGVEPDG
ncbi:MAG: hypothetical protein JO092_08395 [Candidatus Eremiobacteraeota bacterium]|nr:hypothetical protein [Candidatus Eremiobacteraeota bacterium]